MGISNPSTGSISLFSYRGMSTLSGLTTGALSLGLDFTANTALSPLITFTRATTATRVNSSRLIETVASGVMRANQYADYDPTTGVCLGALIEEARTNMLTRSQEIDQPQWTKTGTTVSANAVVSPDGTQNGDTIVENSSSSLHSIANAAVVVSGTTYTVSVFLKAAGRGFALMALTGAFPTTAIQINLTSGAVTTGTGSPLRAFTQTLPNGWFRVGFSLAATSSASASCNVYCSADGLWANRTYLGDGASGITVWGAQLEAGAFVSSYIPTVAAAVPRNADVASIAGASFTPIWNPLAGTTAIQWRQRAVLATYPILTINDGTADEIIIFRGATTNPEMSVTDGSGNTTTLDAGTIAANTSHRMAGAYAANDLAVSLDGAAVVTGSETMPTVDRMLIGSDGTTYLNGWIANLTQYRTRLPNDVVREIA